MRILEGWARKVALILLCLSAVGWIVYVVGLGLFYQDFRIATRFGSYDRLTFGRLSSSSFVASFDGSTLTQLYTPFWMFLGSGILVYLLGIPYLLLGNSFLGLATNIITAISLATGGIVLFETGFVICIPTFTVSSNNDEYIVLSFAGCLIAEIFLGISTLLWPFFVINPPEFCINLTEQDRWAFGGRHPYHFQPESSSQQPVYSQLAPIPPPPQAVPMEPVAAAVPGYMPATRFMASGPNGLQQY